MVNNGKIVGNTRKQWEIPKNIHIAYNLCTALTMYSKLFSYQKSWRKN